MKTQGKDITDNTAGNIEGINIYDLPDTPLDNELTTILLENDNVRIERIVSTGQTTGWYDQDEDEFVTLITGSARLEFEDREILLNAGDSILIAAHEKHRVSYTSSDPACIWLCVFIKR